MSNDELARIPLIKDNTWLQNILPSSTTTLPPHFYTQANEFAQMRAANLSMQNEITKLHGVCQTVLANQSLLNDELHQTQLQLASIQHQSSDHADQLAHHQKSLEKVGKSLEAISAWIQKFHEFFQGDGK